MIRHREGQAGYDDVRERLPRDIHAGPEAIRPEENAIHVPAELLHHAMARHAVALHKQTPTFPFEMLPELIGSVLHGAIAREEHEGLALAELDGGADRLHKGFPI